MKDETEVGTDRLNGTETGLHKVTKQTKGSGPAEMRNRLREDTEGKEHAERTASSNIANWARRANWRYVIMRIL